MLGNISSGISGGGRHGCFCFCRLLSVDEGWFKLLKKTLRTSSRISFA
jgi:hypothetical protein